MLGTSLSLPRTGWGACGGGQRPKLTSRVKLYSVTASSHRSARAEDVAVAEHGDGASVARVDAPRDAEGPRCERQAASRGRHRRVPDRWIRRRLERAADRIALAIPAGVQGASCRERSARRSGLAPLPRRCIGRRRSRLSRRHRSAQHRLSLRVARGFIDWDSIRPNDPIVEFGTAAWKYVPLGDDVCFDASEFPTRPAIRQRLALFAHAYGVHDRKTVRWAVHQAKQRSGLPAMCAAALEKGHTRTPSRQCPQRRGSPRGSASSTAGSRVSSPSRMCATVTLALVAVLVVPCQAGHSLLEITARRLVEKQRRLATSKDRGYATVMTDHDLAIAPLLEGESARPRHDFSVPLAASSRWPSNAPSGSRLE
jgi:hypothetical protein